MKAKNVSRHLRKKVDEWLESIEDKEVRKLASEGTIVCGGAIASLLLGERVNDYDLYFKDKKTCLAVTKYYVQKLREAGNPLRYESTGEEVPISVIVDDNDRIKIVVKSAGVVSEDGGNDYQYFETIGDPGRPEQEEFLNAAVKVVEDEADEDKPPYRPVYLTSNAITLSDKVQLIIRFYGPPKEILENYDFMHVTNYWCSWTQGGRGTLSLRKDALECLLTKELRVINNGTRYPFAAICRIRKFLNRDFHIAAGEILKLCFAVNELNLNDFEVLEDQLIGVDLAYFFELIGYLRAHKDEWYKEGEGIPTPYLLDLIDRLL